MSSSARAWLRCLLIALTCAALALATTSCATGVRATPAPPPSPPPPAPQSNLVQACPELPQPADDLWATLIANHDDVAALYRACAGSKAQLIAAVHEWQRTAWAWYCEAVLRAGAEVASCARDGPGGQGDGR